MKMTITVAAALIGLATAFGPAGTAPAASLADGTPVIEVGGHRSGQRSGGRDFRHRGGGRGGRMGLGVGSLGVVGRPSGIGGGAGESPSYEAIHLVQIAPESPATVLPTKDDVIVIFDGERYLDTDLNPLDPASVTADGERRIVLAVDPSVRLADVMAARARIAVSNLVIANLDSRWRAAIEAAKAAGND